MWHVASTGSTCIFLSDVSFPKHIFPADLANSFGHYFVQKKNYNINKSLDDPTPSLASEAGDGVAVL